MAPDSMAETWLGAAGWASGSQTCKGKKPALAPNPARASRNRAEGAASLPWAAAWARASKPVSPAPAQKAAKKASTQTAPRWAATR